MPAEGLVGCGAAAATNGRAQPPEGLGGNVLAFATDHVKADTSSYGNAVAANLFSLSCLPDRDIVAMIDYHIEDIPSDDGAPTLMSEDEVVQAARDNYLAPADSRLVSARVPGPCKLLTMHSDALASAISGVDLSGNFVIELTRPLSDRGGQYDPNRIGDMLLTLDTQGDC